MVWYRCPYVYIKCKSIKRWKAKLVFFVCAGWFLIFVTYFFHVCRCGSAFYVYIFMGRGGGVVTNWVLQGGWKKRLLRGSFVLLQRVIISQRWLVDALEKCQFVCSILMTVIADDRRCWINLAPESDLIGFRRKNCEYFVNAYIGCLIAYNEYLVIARKTRLVIYNK